MIRAVIETDKGTIRAEFDDQHAPITVKNFVD
ncbi:MAG: peptidylprolyl isomerase, partial [Pseudanabaena sp. CAN_BIN31]|nr:peptidylprolyl isomerase [Pseudanabaena sp. CAN_BIN31]